MSQNKAPKKRPPPCEIFFQALHLELNPTEFERIQAAYYFSKYGHAKQVRDDGSRYFDHPKGAAWIYISELSGRDPNIIILLLIHDLSEDQKLLSPYRVAINFGVEVAHDLAALTKLPKGKEGTSEYLMRVIDRGPRAIVAKLIDRLHNLRDVHDKEKHERTILESQKYHIPLLIPALQDHGSKWTRYVEFFKRELSTLCT
jgi:(p)ppGpp synthase/HD superfamily hydrolase